MSDPFGGRLLLEVGVQLSRRAQMYHEAGGDPRELQGDLTCYLPYRLLRTVFLTKANGEVTVRTRRGHPARRQSKG